MDYLHACYESVGRWGPDASDTFTMRWYWAAATAKEYPFRHAFGTTVDKGCYNPDPMQIGEIPQQGRDHALERATLYDGSETPAYSAALDLGPNALAMRAPCFDGQLGFGSTVTGPTTHVTAFVCSCSGAIAPTS